MTSRRRPRLVPGSTADGLSARLRALLDKPGIIEVAILLALPIVLAVLNPFWTFQPALGGVDPYLYTGHFRDLRLDLRDFLYQGSRLPWLLVGNAAYSLASPEIANLFLRFLLFFVGTLSLFITVRKLWNNTLAATLSALLLGTHAYFLIAIRTDYVNGPIIASLLLSMALIALARDARRWQLLFIATGAAQMFAFSCNIFLGAFVPAFAFSAIAFGSPVVDLKRYVTSLVCLFIGAALLFAVVCAINQHLTGHFFYLEIQIRAIFDLPREGYRAKDLTWLRNAGWLILPAICDVVSLAVVVVGLRDRRLGRVTPGLRLVGLAAIQYLALASFFLFWDLVVGSTYQYLHYTSLLMPYMFLVLGGVIAQSLENRSRPRELAIIALAGVVLIAPLAVEALQVQAHCGVVCSLDGPPIIPSVVAGLLLVATVVKRQPALVLVAIAALSISNTAGTNGKLEELFGIKRDAGVAHDEFLLVYDIDDAVWPYNRNGKLHYWFDHLGPQGGVYNGAVALRFWFPRILSWDFPGLTSIAFPDQQNPVPLGEPIVILTTDPSARERADAKLSAQGLRTDLIDHLTIRHGSLTADALIVKARPLGRDVPLRLDSGVQIMNQSGTLQHLKTPADAYVGAAAVRIPEDVVLGKDLAFVKATLTVLVAPIDVCVLNFDGSVCLAQETITRPGPVEVLLRVPDFSKSAYVVIRSGAERKSGEASLDDITVIVP